MFEKYKNIKINYQYLKSTLSPSKQIHSITSFNNTIKKRVKTIKLEALNNHAN